MKIFKATILVGALIAAGCFTTAASAVTLTISAVTKTMSDGASVNLWTFGGTLPGPQVEVTVGDTLTLGFNMMGGGMGGGSMPMEGSPYSGHTIHMHGADVNTLNDGVPETTNSNGAPNGAMSASYQFTPTANMEGSIMYHCHVHTVKHLEMGLYGALIVRPRDAAGKPIKTQLTSNTKTTYKYEQTYVFSTIDPAYHTATGDSPVFANYTPKYFLISGNESATKTAGTTVPAITLAAAVNSKVALRLIGLQAVNGTFSIKDAAGNAVPFTIYVQDGRALPTEKTNQASLDIAPAQRYDIIFTTPASSGAVYPQITYKNLRDGTAYPNSTTYGKVTF